MIKIKTGIFLAAIMASSLAWAGYTQPAPVEIILTETGGSASGDMLSARNSKNNDEFIGCGVRYVEIPIEPDPILRTEAVAIGFCQAQIADGEEQVCFTYNKELIEGMRMNSDSTFFRFAWTEDEVNGKVCTRIGTSNQSFYLPKGKRNKVKN